ncbi:hypothetical protein R1flu_027744 [Riccia fluitans]|uniref:Uncharacterized protein n=1 Tax=Riccia fluitans TaxID=41844 RepID=A0ABD1XJS2_9MARC
MATTSAVVLHIAIAAITIKRRQIYQAPQPYPTTGETQPFLAASSLPVCSSLAAFFTVVSEFSQINDTQIILTFRPTSSILYGIPMLVATLRENETRREKRRTKAGGTREIEELKSERERALHSLLVTFVFYYYSVFPYRKEELER